MHFIAISTYTLQVIIYIRSIRGKLVPKVTKVEVGLLNPDLRSDFHFTALASFAQHFFSLVKLLSLDWNIQITI